MKLTPLLFGLLALSACGKSQTELDAESLERDNAYLIQREKMRAESIRKMREQMDADSRAQAAKLREAAQTPPRK